MAEPGAHRFYRPAGLFRIAPNKEVIPLRTGKKFQPIVAIGAALM